MKDLKDEYRKMIEEDVPDLWGRIEASLPGRPEIKPAKSRFRGRKIYYMSGIAAACVCVAILIPLLTMSGRMGRSGSADLATAEAAPAAAAFEEEKAAAPAAAEAAPAAAEEPFEETTPEEFTAEEKETADTERSEIRLKSDEANQTEAAIEANQTEDTYEADQSGATSEEPVLASGSAASAAEKSQDSVDRTAMAEILSKRVKKAVYALFGLE